ncbi:MAG: hypothetical protein ACTHXC_00500 [Brachybacterium sp.]
MIEHIHPDGLPTPTVRELYDMKNGYAEATAFDKKMNPTAFRLLPKGSALLAEIMHQNAAGTLERGSATWEATQSIIKARKARAAEERKSGKKQAWTPA